MELPGQRDERRLRRDVRPEQDHPADLAGADPGEEARGRRRPVHPDDQLLADQLGQRRAGRGRRRWSADQAEAEDGAEDDPGDGAHGSRLVAVHRGHRDHGCIWISAGRPGPLQGGTVASVGP